MEIYEPEVENVTLGLLPRVAFSTKGLSYFLIPRTTVCHMFCRMANYNNLDLQVAYSGET